MPQFIRVRLPAQVQKIREFVPEVFHLPGWEIIELWERFSEDTLCASNIRETPDNLEHFREWLLDDYDCAE